MKKKYIISNKLKCKRGFTLAEAMISFMILAVTAVILIPAINQDTEDVQNITRFKKMYGTLRDAHRAMMQLDKPDFHPDYRYNNDKFANGMLKYLKVSKTCMTNSLGVCWPSMNYYLNGKSASSSSNVPNSSTRVDVLENGMSIYFTIAGDACNYPDRFRCGSNQQVKEIIAIDINGLKEPNMWGADQFFFISTVDQLVPNHTIGGGRDCSYAIFQGENLSALKLGKSHRSYQEGTKVYNKCG